MRKWTDVASTALLIILALTWAGAKLHFFTRMGSPEYFSEHWPFWAAMGIIVVLLRVIGAIGRKGQVD